MSDPLIRACNQYVVLEPGENEKILSAIRERDHQDKNRILAPLKAAEDSKTIDTGNMNIDEVIIHLLKDVDRK